MTKRFDVDKDITKAETLPGAFYNSTIIFEELRKKIFLKSWHWIGDESMVPRPETVYPFVLLDKFMSEPMVLARDKEGELHCLSNVCSHRANIVALKPSKCRDLVCTYHGRKFGLDGRFKSMPEFSLVKDFPRACDHLHRFKIRKWEHLLFTGLSDNIDFDEVIASMDSRIGFLNLSQFKHDEKLDKIYKVDAHWALYCDNYLEGFHIPFVHEGLNQVLDYSEYSTELLGHSILQIGYAKPTDQTFNLPTDHIDYGKNIAAYYFFVFPNMMFNFYPWGLSINIVQPENINRTTIIYRSYVLDPSKLNDGAGAGLDTVELEDEEVVQNVNKGIKSNFYKTGRYSPTKEQGVHHFHRLLVSYLD